MRPLRIALFHAPLPSPRRKIGRVEAAVHHLASTLAADRSVEVTVLSCGEPPAGAAYCHKQAFPFALGNACIAGFVLTRIDLRNYAASYRTYPFVTPPDASRPRAVTGCTAGRA